jgi:hypothetical protein
MDEYLDVRGPSTYIHVSSGICAQDSWPGGNVYSRRYQTAGCHANSAQTRWRASARCDKLRLKSNHTDIEIVVAAQP